jgi:hypothetical protein
MYQCKIGQKHHCCNQKFWSIFSTTFTQIGKILTISKGLKRLLLMVTLLLKKDFKLKCFVLETGLKSTTEQRNCCPRRKRVIFKVSSVITANRHFFGAEHFRESDFFSGLHFFVVVGLR